MHRTTNCYVFPNRFDYLFVDNVVHRISLRISCIVTMHCVYSESAARHVCICIKNAICRLSETESFRYH